MGWDHSLSCVKCKERLIIARNKKIFKDEDSLRLLEKFLNKHADHQLIFDADDELVRVLNCLLFKETNESDVKQS